MNFITPKSKKNKKAHCCVKSETNVGVRGGSYIVFSEYLTSTNVRGYLEVQNRYNRDYGFRCSSGYSK